MKLPDMPYKDKIKKAQQTKFGGLNLSVGAGDGEICDMLNMVSNDYPVLSSRPPRYTKTNITADNGLIYIADEAYYVNGTTLYHDGTDVGTLTDSKKKFAVMPYYLIIFPDKKAVRLGVKGYYATLAALEAAVTNPGNNDIYVIGTDAYYWTGTEWKKSGKEIEPMESTWSGSVTFLAEGEYAGVSAQNNTIYNASVEWSDYFRVGDAVNISGCTKHTENNMTPIIREIDGNYLRFYENVFTLDKNYYYEIAERLYIGTSDTSVIFEVKVDDTIIQFDSASLKSYATLTDSKYYLPVGGTFILSSDFSLTYRADENTYILHSITANIYQLLNLKDSNSLNKKTYAAGNYYIVDGDVTFSFTITSESPAVTNSGYFSYHSPTLSTVASLDFYYGTSGITSFDLYDLEMETGVTILDLTTESIDTLESSVTLKRTIPDMDFIFCNDNRLWGCKNDTIYASKLGDPFNFNVMDSLSTDSYATESGTHGDFTGVISYISYPIFFKEDHILKIYGTKPSDFQIYDTASNGVKAGSEQSLAIAGETLYYQSKAGIMAYTGGTPSLVSIALGNVIYKNGIAGSDGNKYFIDLTNGTTHYLFVYDPLRQMWHKEEPLGNAFIYFSDELWSYDGETLTALSALSAPAGATKEDEVEWSVEFADFTVESPNRKGISRFYLRCEVTGTMDVYIQCDGGEWVKRFSCADQSKRSLSIPIIPQRADHYRIKLTGKGEVKVYSLTTDYYVGSEN